MPETSSEKNLSSPVTVRLSDQLTLPMEALAIVDGDNFASQMRKAVEFYREKRCSDPNFPQELEAARIRINTVLDSLLEN